MELEYKPTYAQPGKRWNIYFLEFMLIFMAVALGFFAESIREDLGDQDKEKEFITSMIEDAITDSVHLQNAINGNQKRLLKLDSLSKLLCRFKERPGVDSEIYRLYRFGINHPEFVSPTERTMTQLKNAGGMRLIRKKPAVDAIVQYDDMSKNLVDQQAYYELYQNKSLEQAVVILNFQDFNFEMEKLGPNSNIYTNSALLTHDKAKLIEFGNRVTIYAGIVQFYIFRLKEMKEQTRTVITTLQKEYPL